MWRKVLASSAFALTVGALGGELEAQAGTAPAQEDSTRAGAEVVGEPVVDRKQQIQARLSEVQKQALQDAGVQAANAEIGTLIAATAARLDPNYLGYGERGKAIKEEWAAAQEAGDNEKLHALADEAKQLQVNIAAAQARARQDAAVQAKLNEYKVKLFNRMVEIDPTVRELVKELETLQ